MMKTLFLQAPSFDGFDGGAGSRYQARREIRSFWYPTWLAQPAALVEDTKLIDAPPHRLGIRRTSRPTAASYDLAVLHTSTPSFASRRQGDRGAEGGQSAAQGRLHRRQGRGRAGREPERLAQAIDFVARNEFDFTIKEVAEGRDWRQIDGLSYRNARRRHRAQRDRADPGEHGRAAVRDAGLQARPRRSRTTSSAI